MKTKSFETPSDLLEAAAAVERAAARRYRELAEEMKRAGNIELEAIFEQLAVEEAAHLQTLQEWAGSDSVGATTEGDWRRTGPEVNGDEDEPPDPYTLTPYRALSIAVHNEERAFAFFSAVAADAEDPAVRELAERLAHEELGHAARLRKARRAAYRATGRRPGLHRWALPRAEIEDLSHFRRIAAALELGIAERHEAVAAAITRDAAADAASVAHVARQSRDAASSLEPSNAEPPRRAEDATLPTSVPEALRDMLLDLEEAYAFYAGVADAGPDQHIVEEAQRLSQQTLGRLATVREALSQGQTPPWH